MEEGPAQSPRPPSSIPRTLSVFADVPEAHRLEGSLLKAYRQDDHPNKLFLVYRVCMTQDTRPWISLVVQRTRQQIARDPSLRYEHLPGAGLGSFVQASLQLLFGKHSPAIVENRAGGVHTVGESGAFRLGAQFLRVWRGVAAAVCIVSHRKESHGLVFRDMGFTVHEYCLWDPARRRVDSDMFLDVVEHLPADCVLVIGNPVDCGLTPAQWAALMSTMKRKHIFPFIDIPCQGLSTGDLEEDARVLQYFVAWGFEFFCSQYLSANFGLYDEGVGLLVAVALSNQQLLCVLSQLRSYAQALWLSPPARGARIVTTILCNPALQEEWKLSVKGVVESVMLVKEKLKEKLRLLGTPGSWDHITQQAGIYGYLGLTYQQVQYLIEKKHIYIHKNSRINFSCINASNIDYLTESTCEAVLSTKPSEKQC